MVHGSSGKSMDGIKAPTFDGSQVCAQVDPELFFPEGSAETMVNLRMVKPLCDSCEFQIPCLEYALENQEIVGIWAGTTDRDRVRIRRRTRRIA